MGAIKLATSNNTDEEYGGTFENDWQYVDTKAVGTALAIPSGAKELYIMSQITGDDTIIISTHIIVATLTTSQKIFKNGYFVNTSNNASSAVIATTSAVTLQSFHYGGTSQSNSQMIVYAKI